MRSFKAFINAIRYCLRLSWKTSWFYTVVRLAALFAIALIPYISMFATKHLIDMLSTGQSIQASMFVLPLLAIALGGFLSAVSGKVIQYMQTVHNDMLTNRIALNLMNKTTTMDMEFFDSPDYLDTLQAVSIDSMSLVNIIWNVFTAISYLITYISAVVMICTYSWVYALVLTIAAIPSALVTQKYTQTLYRWRLDHMNDERQMSYFRGISSDRDFASDVRLYGLGQFFVKRYQDIWTAFFTGRKSVQRKQLFTALLVSLLPEICVFFLLLDITASILGGSNSVGDFTLYTGLFATLTTSVYTLISALASVYEDKLRVDTVQKFEARENKVQDTGTLQLVPGSMEIEFENVSFCYPNFGQDVLKGVSFKLAPKEKACLIGLNGAGKSTIIKLLLRFYDPTSGAIYVNGKDIRSYSLLSLRRGISTFFQEFVTYALPLRENVAISDPGRARADDTHIFELLQLVGAQYLPGKLPNGLESYIKKVFDDKGYEPSGGEAQKIALARALYRKCNLIIFDEPSSSLDPVSEYEFFESIQSFWEDKTALFTSHRLSAVFLADKIIFLEDGQITEQGTHEELMISNGKYAEVYRLQAGKYR